MLSKGDEFKKCIIPKLFSLVQSDTDNSMKARKKFIIIEVIVKRKFGIECFHLL